MNQSMIPKVEMPHPDNYIEPNRRDLELIVTYMYDPKLGIDMLTQALVRGDQFEKACWRMQDHINSLQEKVTKFEEADLQDWMNERLLLNKAVEDAKKSDAFYKETLSKRAKEQAALEEENKNLTNELFEERGKYKVKLQDVLSILKNRTKALAQHMREAGLRDVDEVWVEEGKRLALDVSTTIEELRSS